MASSSSGPQAAVLTAPPEFPFPFEAYSVQKELMHKLWSAIETGAVGVFESPTGSRRPRIPPLARAPRVHIPGIGGISHGGFPLHRTW